MTKEFKVSICTPPFPSPTMYCPARRVPVGYPTTLDNNLHCGAGSPFKQPVVVITLCGGACSDIYLYVLVDNPTFVVRVIEETIQPLPHPETNSLTMLCKKQLYQLRFHRLMDAANFVSKFVTYRAYGDYQRVRLEFTLSDSSLAHPNATPEVPLFSRTCQLKKDAGSLSDDDDDDDDESDEERLPLFTPALLDDFLEIQQSAIIEKNEVIAVRPVV